MTITETDSVQVRFRVGTQQMGWAPVWAVDEDGCLLNTEPVCSVPIDWHGWFVGWLVDQLPPMKMLSRLDCPVRRAANDQDQHSGGSNG